MPETEIVDAAKTQILQWLQEKFNQPAEAFGLYPIQHLSTRHYAFVTVEPRQIMGAGHIFLLSDGREILETGKESFVKVLQRENFIATPSAIPPATLADLYLRLVETSYEGGIIKEEAFLPPDLSGELRARYAPPKVDTSGGQVMIDFWTTYPIVGEVCVWEVAITPDYDISATKTQVAG